MVNNLFVNMLLSKKLESFVLVLCINYFKVR